MKTPTAILIALAALLGLVGCCTVPDTVDTAIDGNLGSWRLVKKDLVQTMPDGEVRELWLKRLAAFIVRARSIQAWAKDDENFDTVAAFKQEMARQEE